jgi:DNA relaxase NicK
LIQSEDRGDTLYVGSRASDQLGRLYDKGRQSGEDAYKDCWRWEVQYRRGPAMSVVRALLQTECEASAIAATVARWFTDRGVSAGYHTSGQPLLATGVRIVPDDERWLAWARRCVAPRAKGLAVRYGWRYVAETLVGHITTYEEWESLVRGVEFEVQDAEGY